MLVFWRVLAVLEVCTDSTVLQRFRGFFHQRWEKSTRKVVLVFKFHYSRLTISFSGTA